VATYDGNGNSTASTDASTGANSAVFEYGPFGEPLRVTGPAALAMPLRFSTMYEDDVTGDRKYLLREYRPSLGRWLNRDPLEEKGGRNLYAFVRNQPISRIDSDGRVDIETQQFRRVGGGVIPNRRGPTV
jgi:RHS repeat-associated protein